MCQFPKTYRSYLNISKKKLIRKHVFEKMTGWSLKISLNKSDFLILKNHIVEKKTIIFVKTNRH